MRWNGFLLALLVSGWSSSAAAWELGWVAKLGGEYDSNAGRVLGEQSTADGVVRAYGSVDARGSVGQAGLLAAGARLGARLPFATRAEDSLTTLVTAQGRRWGRGDLWWGGDAELRDASLRSNTRDYTRVAARLRMGWEPGVWRVSWGGGASKLWFWPEPRLNSVGPDAFAELGVEPVDGLTLLASGDVSYRAYDEPRYGQNGPALVVEEEFRRDTVSGGAGVVRYTSGRLALMAGYRAQRGASDSVGRSYFRHAVEGEVGVVPFADVLVRVAGRYQHTRYDDPASIDATLLLDDDARSSVSLTIEVPLPGEHFGIETRMEHFADRADEQRERYERWVAYVGFSARGVARLGRDAGR